MRTPGLAHSGLIPPGSTVYASRKPFGGDFMLDVSFVALGGVFFLTGWAFLHACARL